MELNDEFYNKFYNLDSEVIRELAKYYLDIGNVLRGLRDECFALSANFEESNEIQFIYVQFSHENPGYVLKLEFRERNFYDFLLLFSLEIIKINKKLEILSVYNTFVHQIRTLFEANDIITFTTGDIKKFGNPFVFSGSEIEIIKTYDRIKFYRSFLEEEKFKNLIPDVEYVYIMLNSDDLTFKIGQSKNPTYREKTLQSKQPNITLLKVWECDKKIERQLHEIYKEKRTRGEWFKLDSEDFINFNKIINNLIDKNNTL